MAKVSVIMATYNCENTLHKAIDSILAQTYEDWEFVICDDKSTDNTYQILLQYQQRYPNKFVVIQNEVNSKLPFSLNHCLQYASGEYIARMDGDDISMPQRLQKQVEYLEQHPECAVIGTSMIRFDENGEYAEFGIYEAVKNPNKYTLMSQVPFCHATIMMRKVVYDALEGYTVSKRTERGQDVDLWFRFYALGYSGENLIEPLYKVCEDRAAIKRRKFKYQIYATQTRIRGFRMLNYPIHRYYLAVTPILSYFVPRKIKLLIRGQKKD